jgi:phosphatidylserine/phosphatidylglycerophosphate/cardiolipin synthase-like enzyme
VIELQKEYQEAYNRLWNNLQELWEENENLRKEIKRQSFWIDIITSLCIVCLLAWVAAVHYWK